MLATTLNEAVQNISADIQNLISSGVFSSQEEAINTILGVYFSTMQAARSIAEQAKQMVADAHAAEVLQKINDLSLASGVVVPDSVISQTVTAPVTRAVVVTGSVI